MKRYRINLREEPSDKFTLLFECLAEDEDQAEERAEGAYPGYEVIHVSKVATDGA